MIRKTSLYIGAIFASIVMLTGSTGLTQAYATTYEEKTILIPTCEVKNFGIYTLGIIVFKEVDVTLGVWEQGTNYPTFEMEYTDFPVQITMPFNANPFDGQCIPYADLKQIEFVSEIMRHDLSANLCLSIGSLRGDISATQPVTSTHSIPGTDVGWTDTEGIIEEGCAYWITNSTEIDKWLLHVRGTYELVDNSDEIFYQTTVFNTIDED